MPRDWINVKSISFNTLLLFERVQLSWLPGWYGLPYDKLALALRANPAVEWSLRHKCPDLNPWLDEVLVNSVPADELGAVRAAEVAILNRLQDLIVYALDPEIYDQQAFLGWDSRELTGLVDFTGKNVIDVGAGTGRLTFVAAEKANAVYAVDPVENLRHYLRGKAAKLGLKNVFPQEGLITRLPFHDSFADITMGGHVYGDEPEAELSELERVTRPGGMVILCPGNSDRDDTIHAYLINHSYAWSRFEEPQDGPKRKYWKTLLT